MRKFEIGEIKGYIAKDGKTDYAIVLPKNADCAEEYAAEELQRLIDVASSCKVEIVYGNTDKKALYLNAGKAIGETILSRNGFSIKTEKENVYIDGIDRNGLIFGVYRFMELVADYMYFAEDEMRIANYVAFKNLDVIDYSDFKNTDVYNVDTRDNPVHARRLFLTGGNYSIQEAKYGEGSWWSSLWDQSFCDQLVDHKIYKQKFPHWYSMPYELPKFQLCYTEALYSRDEYEKGDFSEENYEDGRHGLFWTLVYNLITKYIAVEKDKILFQLGMNDGEEFCTCPRCSADKEKYGQSGVCIRFVNAVADEVEKWRKENCPERQIYLTMFAYYSTFDAPVKEVNGELVPMDKSVIVRDNVMVRFTPMGAYYMFPFTDEVNNPTIKASLEGWSKVAKHFTSWDYRVDFYSFISPFCQWMAAAENMRTYYKYGFEDVMYQGSSSTGGTPFVALDNYVRSRFSWDTSQDYDKLTDYFIDNYYHEGAESIKEYRAYLTEHYKRIYKEQDYKGHSHCGVTRRYNFPFESIQKIESIFAKGYEAIAKIEKSEPERYARAKRHMDTESLFYRFMKVAFYPEHYTNEERIEEIGNFEQMAKVAKLKVVCNNQDYTYNVIHVLRMPLEDRKGQIIYY